MVHETDMEGMARRHGLEMLVKTQAELEEEVRRQGGLPWCPDAAWHVPHHANGRRQRSGELTVFKC